MKAPRSSSGSLLREPTAWRTSAPRPRQRQSTTMVMLRMNSTCITG
jgi:hypothetical protein